MASITKWSRAGLIGPMFTVEAVRKVMAQYHPDIRLASHGATYLITILTTIKAKLATAEGKVFSNDGLQSITVGPTSSLIDRLRAVLPGALCKHTISEVYKARHKYLSCFSGPPPTEDKLNAGHVLKMDGDLINVTTDINEVMQMAAYEYLTAELCELAGNHAKDCHATTVTPYHLDRAILGDEELSDLLRPHLQVHLEMMDEMVGLPIDTFAKAKVRGDLVYLAKLVPVLKKAFLGRTVRKDAAPVCLFIIKRFQCLFSLVDDEHFTNWLESLPQSSSPISPVLKTNLNDYCLYRFVDALVAIIPPEVKVIDYTIIVKSLLTTRKYDFVSYMTTSQLE